MKTKLEKYILYTKERWAIFFTLFLLYIIRVYFKGGYYVISYLMGLFLLHLSVQRLIPVGVPDLENDDDENFPAELPQDMKLKNNQDPEEYKPVIRNLSEFKYWQYLTLVIFLANICITFEIFDLPVFWPFLLFYFIILCVVTCKRLYDHMQKYGYGVFDKQKTTYKQEKK